MRPLGRVWCGLGAFALGFQGGYAPRPATAQECLSVDGYRATYAFVGRSANDDDRNGWFTETQGLTNGHPDLGHPYWYLSKNYNFLGVPAWTYIYAVPYSEHLKNNFDYYERPIAMPDGASGICFHVGGIDYHRYECGEACTATFIAAGYDQCDSGKARIGFFDPLEFDGSNRFLAPHATLDVSDAQGKDCPWVSVRSDGRIYSSAGGINPPRLPYTIFEYTIDWNQVLEGTDPVPTQVYPITLRDYSGAPLWLKERQAGDFSPDDQLFFFHAKGFNEEDGRIFVFEVRDGNSWYLVKRSSVSEYPFWLDSDPSEFSVDELEGLSYYDMNCVEDYHSGMPRAELHSMVLHNTWGTEDELTIHHYTSLLGTTPDLGIWEPFYQWWDGHGLWDGANLVLQPGTYVEEMTLKGKKVRIISPNGTSSIRIP